ncbi:MspA family porin [Nocardia sp. 004]|uniref:MspA family porin n=1 Tax=Nocardia sp. 004 TaxID=3385978 RepID=UPI0039A104EF
MNRRHSHTLAMITAVILAMTGAIAAVDTPAAAAPGEVRSGGLHLIASVDSNTVTPAGGDTATGIPFAHTVKVAGNYSVTFDGTSPLRHGQIIAGYLIGCAVNVADGITIGIVPQVNFGVGFAPFVALNLAIDAPPSITVGFSPQVFMGVGLAGQFAMFLAPGNVTAVVVGAAELDSESEFPYTFAHNNTPLNISGCLSPATAMPFVTVRADGINSSVQTTGYGDQFVF